MHNVNFTKLLGDDDSVLTGVDQDETWEGTPQDSVAGGVSQDDTALEGEE